MGDAVDVDLDLVMEVAKARRLGVIILTRHSNTLCRLLFIEIASVES